MQIFGIEVTNEYFDYLMCEQAKGKEIKLIDGNVVAVDRVITEEEKRHARIEELKSLLSLTDYKVLKYVEGEMTFQELEPVMFERKAWRDEINSLGG